MVWLLSILQTVIKLFPAPIWSRFQNKNISDYLQIDVLLQPEMLPLQQVFCLHVERKKLRQKALLSELCCIYLAILIFSKLLHLLSITCSAHCCFSSKTNVVLLSFTRHCAGSSVPSRVGMGGMHLSPCPSLVIHWANPHRVPRAGWQPLLGCPAFSTAVSEGKCAPLSCTELLVIGCVDSGSGRSPCERPSSASSYQKGSDSKFTPILSVIA